jgi:hypothetical protein
MALVAMACGVDDKACANSPIAASPARGNGNRSRPRSARLGPGKSHHPHPMWPDPALIMIRGSPHAPGVAKPPARSGAAGAGALSDVPRAVPRL